MPAESRLIDEIKKHVKSLGGKTIKIHQSGLSELGIPDLLVITPKHGMVMVEVKAKGKKPEPIQLIRINEIKRAGGRAFWCASLDDFLRQI
jgi:Holliday junction resolvase